MAEADAKPDELSLAALQHRLATLEQQLDAQNATVAELKAGFDWQRLAEIESALLTVSAIAVEIHDHSARSSIEVNQRELRARLAPIMDRVQRAADAAATAKAA